MSYNVQNLFDATHDPGKNDYTFLPISSPLKQKCRDMKDSYYRQECETTDWTENKLTLKLDQIKRVIQSRGALPEVLILSEVENANVVGKLTKHLGYKGFVMTNSPDRRGIDVAILYKDDKLKFLGHSEDGNHMAGLLTRNHLVAHFTPKNTATSAAPGAATNLKSNEILGVYANHWPAQSAPDQMRYDTARSLKDFVDLNRKKFPGQRYNALLTGDFNTDEGDQADGIKSIITQKDWGMRFEDLSANLSTEKKGTYYYRNQWIPFDRMIVSGYLSDGKGIDVVKNSFEVVKPEFATTKWNTPLHYDHNSSSALSAGFSDHFAISVKLKLDNQNRNTLN